MQKFKWHEAAQQQWNERAENWHSRSEAMWDEGSRQSIIPFFKKNISEGSNVIDVGCGDGYGSWKLAKENYQVHGVDLSHDMIKLASSRSDTSEEHLTFSQADMLSLPFDSHSFDALMGINALEWSEVPADALKEMMRVVKPGGHLCIGILGPTAKPRVNSYRRLYGEPVICNTMMPWELGQLAEDHGLTVIDSEGVYKRGVEERTLQSLSIPMKQSLTFMWLYLFQKPTY